MQKMWLAPLVAVVVVACGEKHSVDRPMAEVLTMLSSLPSDADAMSLATSFPGTSYWVEPTPDKVVWHFTRASGEYGRYVAKLSADGPNRTTVTTYIEESGSDANLVFLRDIAKVAGDASVVAALEGRPVDRVAVQRQIQKMIGDNPVAAQMAAIQTVAEEMDRLAPPDPCETGNAEQRNSRVCQDHGHDISADGTIRRSDTGEIETDTNH
ncbi:MAG TPA: hypothetical protein VJM15_07585 [Sphingomicrobium sp.]|nr:hypothetical protein [Sphingomicrobium sp.]